jgi:hypothetical protein
MGATKRLLDDQTPKICGECGADLEWDNGSLTCSADCPTAQMDRYDRMSNNEELRRRGWDAFHDGEAYEDAPEGIAGAAWGRGWKVAERGGSKP